MLRYSQTEPRHGKEERVPLERLPAFKNPGEVDTDLLKYYEAMGLRMGELSNEQDFARNTDLYAPVIDGAEGWYTYNFDPGCDGNSSHVVICDEKGGERGYYIIKIDSARFISRSLTFNDSAAPFNYSAAEIMPEQDTSVRFFRNKRFDFRFVMSEHLGGGLEVITLRFDDRAGNVVDIGAITVASRYSYLNKDDPFFPEYGYIEYKGREVRIDCIKSIPRYSERQTFVMEAFKDAVCEVDRNIDICLKGVDYFKKKMLHSAFKILSEKFPDFSDPNKYWDDSRVDDVAEVVKSLTGLMKVNSDIGNDLIWTP